MSDRMKRREDGRREPPPVENTHDRRSRKRARGHEEQIFENAPKAPDGVSGNWE